MGNHSLGPVLAVFEETLPTSNAAPLFSPTGEIDEGQSALGEVRFVVPESLDISVTT